MLDVNKDDTPSFIFPPALASPTPDTASASALPLASTESAVDSDWTILNKEDATTLSTPIQPSAPLPVSADLKTTFNEPLNEGLRNRKAPPAASSDIPATTDAPDAPAQGSPSTQPAAPQDDRMCRICFGGAEDEETLGRLISPCKCKGSMKHVHIMCLNEWRSRKVKPESFFQCDQCKYKYHFSRTAWAKVLQNELMVTALTVLAFFITILIAGFAAKLFILYVLYDPDDPILMAPPGAPLILPYPYPITTAPTSPANTAPGGTAHPPSPSEPEWTFIDTIFLHHLHPANIRIWAIDFAHFASGVLLVGAVGAFSMLYYLILNPLGITDFGGGTGGFARRGGRRDDVSGLMILVIVVLGVFRAGYGIWKGVRWACRKSLKAVEDRILEVDEEDGNIAPGVPPVAPVPDAAAVPPAQG